MKKIFILIIALFLTTECNGYKPIFGSSNFKFKISSYDIEGEKNLGNMLYSKLYASSVRDSAGSDISNLDLLINISKEKNPTAKDSSGKTLEYKITLKTKILINDFTTGKKLLNRDFISSLSYKVQDQYSDTIRIENQSIENLINKSYQEILIYLSKNTAS